jgi:hypothetical protein
MATIIPRDPETAFRRYHPIGDISQARRTVDQRQRNGGKRPARDVEVHAVTGSAMKHAAKVTQTRTLCPASMKLFSRISFDLMPYLVVRDSIPT